jgi:hypothetical protein
MWAVLEVILAVKPTQLDPAFCAPNVALSNGNLTVTGLAGVINNVVRATKPIPPEGAFWEMTVDAYTTGTSNTAGVVDSTNTAVNGGVAVGYNLTSGGIDMTASKVYNAIRGSLGAPGNVTVGATLLFLYLPAVQHMHMFNPAVGWDTSGNGTIAPDTGAEVYASIGPKCYPAASADEAGVQYTFNFGAKPWVNTAAVQTCLNAGYKPLR